MSKNHRYKRLLYEDRKAIEAMCREGKSAIKIANALGVHRATIYNEFYRSGTNKKTYTAEIGQRALGAPWGKA